MTRWTCWCGRFCDWVSTGYCKWGQVEIHVCPDHGKFEVIANPMSLRGGQIR